jgi:DNA-binding beta-propeller fold protein YncE
VQIAARAAVLSLAAALVACGSTSATTSPARGWPQGRPPSYANPIPAENSLRGEPMWGMGADSNGPLQAYLDRASARAGEVVEVKASSDAARAVTWVLYRFGWYGGAGARRVAEGGPGTVGPQPPCPMEAGTGMIRCAWATAFQIPLSPDLVSGYYGVKLLRDDGWAVLAPLVVVDDRPADLLVEAAVNTWQAYNAWGGESLYVDSSGTLGAGLASRVSFDRPYASGRGLGLMPLYELPFARFLERAGYDVSYTTNLDVSVRGAAHLVRAGAFLSVGHDEYWTGEARDAAEAARDAGVPLLFFGADAAYWKVRYEAPDARGAPRVIACWKSTTWDPSSDPVSGPARTGRFRDPQIGRPENALVGAMYESWLVQRFPLVVADAASWLYDGTGLRENDVIPLVTAAEYDVVVDNGYQPAGTHVVARLQLVDAYGVPGAGTTAYYRAPSGALVFAAGTIEWPLGVDRASDAYDPRMERMTANVIREALGLAVPAGVGGPPPDRGNLFAAPQGPSASAVSTVATGLDAPSGVAVLADGSLAVATPRAQRIVRVSAAGAVEPLAGDGHLSSSPTYDGVPGAQARFYDPTAVLAMPDGAVLVADTLNHCIRRIAPDAARMVTTFAGRMNAPGYVDGVAAGARFRAPLGLARDPVSGAVLVADSGNHAVRAIDARGNVMTLAGGRPVERDGPAATAGFLYPSAIATAPDGRVFVVASRSGTVKRIGTDPARTVTTIAGTGSGAVDGTGDRARMSPQGGALWAGGRVVVADGSNFRIRALSPGAGAADTWVWTYAGTGQPGSRDGGGSAATFGFPLGLAAAPDGRVFVADAANGSIRVLSAPPP